MVSVQIRWCKRYMCFLQHSNWYLLILLKRVRSLCHTNGDGEFGLIFNYLTSTKVQIEIMNSIGQKVHPIIDAEVTKDKINVNLSEKANGIYYFKVTSDKNSSTKKVVKS